MFIVYHQTTRVVDSIKLTQAEADARALEVTELTSHQGTVTVPRWVQPGRSLYKTDGTFGEEIAIPTPSELQATKAVMKAVHAAFFGDLWNRIQAASLAYPSSLRELVTDIIVGQVRGVYEICKDDTTYTLLQRQGFVQQAILGPSEVTGQGTPEGISKFFKTVNGVTLPTGFVRGNPLNWVIVQGGGTGFARRSLQLSVNNAATDFTTTSNYDDLMLFDDGWIDNITV